jgi:hypothetical protein
MGWKSPTYDYVLQTSTSDYKLIELFEIYLRMYIEKVEEDDTRLNEIIHPAENQWAQRLR